MGLGFVGLEDFIARVWLFDDERIRNSLSLTLLVCFGILLLLLLLGFLLRVLNVDQDTVTKMLIHDKTESRGRCQQPEERRHVNTFGVHATFTVNDEALADTVGNGAFESSRAVFFFRKWADIEVVEHLEVRGKVRARLDLGVKVRVGFRVRVSMVEGLEDGVSGTECIEAFLRGKLLIIIIIIIIATTTFPLLSFFGGFCFIFF